METVTKETALKRITELVVQFDEGYDNYKKTTYDEAKTRGTFIDEFFKALGWDVHNKEGIDESYRDVIPEDKIKIEGSTKAPDYCFTISGRRKFFVEAKKPSVPINTDNASVFQLRRYGYHRKLPISIISNFEEFAVYDCTKKPFLTDKTSVGRIRHINYKEYAKEFDFIWNTFSKESILRGRFDKFAKSDTERRGTSAIDNDFLVSLNEWRKYLATSIAKNNHRLTQEEVQFAVQQTIDRIIFLIFCEYKNIEPFGNLKHAAEKGTVYNNLFEIFNQADQKYNSGLFDFRKDKISERLTIDNKVIKNIIADLYSDNQYDFGILPVEVLGNAYEQFLGKIIRITPGHIVKIEDKPEVRKAGGVFYTPEYIVDYIVKNTVGKLIHGKTPEQIRKIKIVDPACGSGSFLLGAYQFLLNYHRDYYFKHGLKEKKIKNNPLTPEGRLTTEIKREILLNNIFGVDIDRQAVEVTKLSLLLKAMECETDVSIKRQLQLIHERVLPNIDGNIKCGNSLIGQDSFEGQINFDKEEKEELKKKINPFDWKSGFPEIFKQGGFDVVIGNPPYVTIGGKEDTLFVKQEAEYLLTRFISNQYKPNLYAFFYEKGLSLLKEDGLISFIVPRTFIDNIYYKVLREFFVKNSRIVSILKLNYEVFDEATTGGTSICIFQKSISKNAKAQTFEINNQEELVIANAILINQKEILIGENKSFSFSNPETQKIVSEISKENPKLEFFCSVNNGANTGNAANVLLSEKPRNKSYRKILEGKDINRFRTKWKGLWIHYDPNLKNKIKLKDLQTKQNKIDFALRDVRIFDSLKIIIRQTADRIIATLDSDKYITRHSTHCILNDFHPIDLKFLLGVLNSKLMNFYYNALIPEKGKAFAEVKAINVKQLPIKNIDRKIKSESKLHDEIVKQVDNRLQLNKEIRKTRTPAEHEQIQNQISYSENRIDEIVFELYGLSKKDIETIKNNLPIRFWKEN